MKINWQTKKLDDVCEIEYGTRVVKKLDGGSVFPVYGGGGKTFFLDSFNREDRMVIARFAMSEQCTRYIKGKFFLNDSGLTVSPKNSKQIYRRFLDLQLSFLTEVIYSLARGSAQKNLDMPAFRNINVSYPESLSEQYRIVKILDEVFGGIAKVKENTENNLQNAKELFESYLQSIFSNPGEGWEEKTIGEIAEVEYGFTDKAKHAGDFRFIRITDIDDYGNLEPDNKMYVKYSKEAEKHLLEDGDLLMARTGATFAEVLLYKNIEKSIFASYLIRIRFTEQIISKLYWYFSKSKPYWDQARSLSSGSAQPQFNGGALKQLVFTYPKSLSEQKTIVAKLDALSEQTKKLEGMYKQKLLDLEELKKSVLKKVFSGEL